MSGLRDNTWAINGDTFSQDRYAANMHIKPLHAEAATSDAGFNGNACGACKCLHALPPGCATFAAYTSCMQHMLVLPAVLASCPLIGNVLLLLLASAPSGI